MIHVDVSNNKHIYESHYSHCPQKSWTIIGHVYWGDYFDYYAGNLCYCSRHCNAFDEGVTVVDFIIHPMIKRVAKICAMAEGTNIIVSVMARRSTCPTATWRNQRGPIFTERWDVVPPNLVKTWSREIRCYNDRIPLKLDRHHGRTAADVPV